MNKSFGLQNGAKKIHFTAICGTGMGSVAVVLKQMGFEITGSDENIYPPMSNILHDNGIRVYSGYSRKNIKDDIDIFVIGNAMSRGNPEVEEILAKKKFYISLPELVKEIFIRGRNSIVITGTHGKSTTTALASLVFEYADKKPGFLIGGVPLNFDSGCRKGDGKHFIIEGDEYDTAFFDKRSKFVHYLPDYLVINNIEFDHADIFNTLDEIILSFKRVANIVPENGLILANGDDPNVEKVIRKVSAPLEKYGFENKNKWNVKNIEYNGDNTTFDVYKDNKFFGKFTLPLPGKCNIINSLAVIALSFHNRIDNKVIQEAFLNFKGLKRRSEIVGVEKGITVIDDFAHHPTAVRETLFGLRKKYNDKRIFAVFEPRTNTTRRKILQNELAEAFNSSDFAVIAKINAPEKVPQDERLSIERLIKDINANGVKGEYIPETDNIISFLLNECKKDDVVVFMSNGGFDNIILRFLDKLRS
ncbi:UDP-N-acetylmuramate:L-alanyl-gamma-D-glutamyl-meso-diaminopimelate ligase [candidate division KSB1 bacterium]